MNTPSYPGASPKGALLTDLMLETFRLNGALLQAGDRLVADIGLTSARWQVLGAIALSDERLPVAHLARNMGLARQSVQRIANELAGEGLVEFAPNPHHKRAHLVVLTKKGWAAYNAAIARHVPWVNGLAKGVKAAEIETALATLQVLRRQLERPGAMPTKE
jgi:DNA-binding MarR family transcriptional regulator